uniref:Uncharacterized protein n=1 Tax=Arion vulgaris TaxID=1028688 RepID=A0A0B7BH79_9EUPU
MCYRRFDLFHCQIISKFTLTHSDLSSSSSSLSRTELSHPNCPSEFLSFS